MDHRVQVALHGDTTLAQPLCHVNSRLWGDEGAEWSSRCV